MEIKFEDGELGSLRQRGEELIIKTPAVHPPLAEKRGPGGHAHGAQFARQALRSKQRREQKED